LTRTDDLGGEHSVTLAGLPKR